MATEDFNTYTEVDDEDDIEITSASKIDVDTIDAGANSYVYKDMGVDHFGDFEHLIEFTTTASDSNESYCIVHGVSNDYFTINARGVNDDGVSTWIRHKGRYLEVKEDEANTKRMDTSTVLTLGTKYYLTIKRDGAAYTVKIYDDSGRTNLIDELEIVCETTAYRYISPFGNRETLSGAQTIVIENLDLQEGVEHTHTPSDTLAISDAVAYKQDHVQGLADTLAMSDSVVYVLTEGEVPVIKRHRMPYGLKPARIPQVGRIGA